MILSVVPTSDVCWLVTPMNTIILLSKPSQSLTKSLVTVCWLIWKFPKMGIPLNHPVE